MHEYAPNTEHLPEHTGTWPRCLQLHQAEVWAVLGKRRNLGPPNRQNSSFRKICSPRLLQQKWSGLFPPEKCLSRSRPSHFPPCSQNNLSGKSTLEVSCPTVSSKRGSFQKTEQAVRGHIQWGNGLPQGWRSHACQSPSQGQPFSLHSVPKQDARNLPPLPASLGPSSWVLLQQG